MRDGLVALIAPRRFGIGELLADFRGKTPDMIDQAPQNGILAADLVGRHHATRRSGVLQATGLLNVRGQADP